MLTGTVLGSFGLGSILMLAVLVRYIYTRHQISSIQGSSNPATGSSGGPSTTRIKVDKVLLLRFSIAFVILAAFEVTIVCFEFQRKTTTDVLAQQQSPDLSTSSAVSEILLFIPGVTAGLVAFLLFGTTAHFRQRYVQAIQRARSATKRRPSLPEPGRGGGDLWDRLDSGEPSQTYRCTVRAGEIESVELGPSSKAYAR